MPYGDIAIISNNRYNFREVEGDANANLCAGMAPAGGAVRVPVFLWGLCTTIDEIDLGSVGPDFAGQTQPMVAVLDTDGDSYVGLSFSADDTPVVEFYVAAGTKRRHVLPNVASDTFALLAAAQTISGVKTFTAAPLFTVAGLAGTFTNTTDGASVQVAIFQGDRATPADNDAAYITLRLSDSAGNQDEGARITWQATTVADGATQDTDLILSTVVNGSLTTFLTLDGSDSLVTVGVAGLTGPATFNLANVTTTTLNLGGAATTIAIGAATSATTWTGQSFTLTGANSTNNTTLTVTNSSNAAAASHSIVDIRVGGTTSTGDPQLRLSVPSGGSFYVGIDNSDNDRLFIGQGTTVGTTPLMRFAAGAGIDSVLVSGYAASLAGGAGMAATRALALEARTLTLSDTAQTTGLVSNISVGILTINQSGGAVTVDKHAGIASVGATAGASVALTHSSAFRSITGGAAVNVSGVYHETQTAGTTGNYQSLYAVSTGARPALLDHASIQAVDFAVGQTRIMIQAETGIEISIGNSTIQPNSATEMAFCVTNAALVVGSEGTVVIPYISTTAAAFTDGIGGDVDGAIGINYDSDSGPVSTIEARVEGAWLSVAVTGYMIQGKTWGGKQGWWHPSQILPGGFVDETRCVVCGEPMKERDSIAMYGNLVVQADNTHERPSLHAIFGHQHLERDPEIVALKKEVAALRDQVKGRGR